MASILTTKALGIIGGVVGVSAVGGGVAYASGLFNNPQPEKEVLIINKTRLENEGFIVLDTTQDSDDWQTVRDAYIAETKNTFTGNKDATRTKESLREECSRKNNLNTTESYSLARQWCVKQETMSTILGKKSRILNTDTTTTDNDIWKTKISALTENDKTTLGVTIDNVEATNITAIKTKCKDIVTKKTTDAEFNEKFDVVKKICVVPKPN